MGECLKGCSESQQFFGLTIESVHDVIQFFLDDNAQMSPFGEALRIRRLVFSLVITYHFLHGDEEAVVSIRLN